MTDAALLLPDTGFNFSRSHSMISPLHKSHSAVGKTFLFMRGQYGLASVFFVRFIVFLIVVNICAFILNSDGTASSRTNIPDDFFDILEGFSAIVFTLEHLVRVYCSVADPKYAPLGPFWGRVRYMRSFHGVVDLCAVLPWYISWVVDVKVGFAAALRVLRMFRLFKFDAYTQAFVVIRDVFDVEKEVLIVTSFYCFASILLCASLLYLIEGQANEFNSIPNALYYMFRMFMGTFPYSQLHAYSKLLICLTALLGLTLMSVPSGVFASRLMEVLAERRKQRQELLKQQDEAEHRAEEEEQGGIDGASVNDRSRRTVSGIMVPQSPARTPRSGKDKDRDNARSPPIVLSESKVQAMSLNGDPPLRVASPPRAGESKRSTSSGDRKNATSPRKEARALPLPVSTSCPSCGHDVPLASALAASSAARPS